MHFPSWRTNAHCPSMLFLEQMLGLECLQPTVDSSRSSAARGS